MAWLERPRDRAGGLDPGRQSGGDVSSEDEKVCVALLGSVAPNALVVRETVAKDVQARERTLDGSALAVGRVRETAGKVRP